MRRKISLERTIEYVHRSYPGIPVILDSSGAMSGNTAVRYAIEAFERYGADAVTVNPYLAGDSLEPFLQYEDKGVIILCRTSNPGGRNLQISMSVGGSCTGPWRICCGGSGIVVGTVCSFGGRHTSLASSRRFATLSARCRSSFRGRRAGGVLHGG